MIRKLLAATAIAALVTSSALAQSWAAAGRRKFRQLRRHEFRHLRRHRQGRGGRQQRRLAKPRISVEQQFRPVAAGRHRHLRPCHIGQLGRQLQGLGAPTNGGTAGAANGVGTPGAAGNQAAMPGSWSGSIGTAFFNSDMTLRSETDIRQNWSALSAAQQQQVRSDCQNINTQHRNAGHEQAVRDGGRHMNWGG